MGREAAHGSSFLSAARRSALPMLSHDGSGVRTAGQRQLRRGMTPTDGATAWVWLSLFGALTGAPFRSDACGFKL